MVVEDFPEAILSLLPTPQAATVVATVGADFSHRLLAPSQDGALPLLAFTLSEL